jgi:hypothetical protein
MIMRYRLVVAVLVGVAFVVSACDDPAPTELSQDTTPSISAAPKKAIPFTAVWDLTGPVNGSNIINPECIVFDAKHVHYDKCILEGSMTGDLWGTSNSLHRGHIILATGYGKGHGHIAMNVCHADIGCGTFKGRYHTESQLPEVMIITEAPGHGGGDFHTLQIRYTGVKRPDAFIFDVEGVIF